MDFFNLEDKENGIIQIQRILRSLDYLDTQLARIRLSGIYDDETRNAVKDFQKRYSLPVTGEVDKTTWDTLHSVYALASSLAPPQRPVYILPRYSPYAISPGAKDDIIYVIQHFLNTLRLEYDELENIPFTGTMDEKTENAIRLFQRKNLLDDTGIIDNKTYNALSGEYERINSREY